MIPISVEPGDGDARGTEVVAADSEAYGPVKLSSAVSPSPIVKVKESAMAGDSNSGVSSRPSRALRIVVSLVVATL